MCRWHMTCCRSRIRSFILPEAGPNTGFLRLFLVLAPNTQHGVSGDCISLQRAVMRDLCAPMRRSKHGVFCATPKYSGAVPGASCAEPGFIGKATGEQVSLQSRFLPMETGSSPDLPGSP